MPCLRIATPPSRNCLQIEASDGRKRDGGHVYPSPSLRFSKTIRFVPLPISNVSRPPRFSSLRNSPFRGKKAFSPRHLYFVFPFLSLRFIFYSRDRGRSKMRWINFEILFAGLRMFPLYGNFDTYQSRDFSLMKITFRIMIEYNNHS